MSVEFCLDDPSEKFTPLTLFCFSKFLAFTGWILLDEEDAVDGMMLLPCSKGWWGKPAEIGVLSALVGPIGK